MLARPSIAPPIEAAVDPAVTVQTEAAVLLSHRVGHRDLRDEFPELIPVIDNPGSLEETLRRDTQDPGDNLSSIIATKLDYQ